MAAADTFYTFNEDLWATVAGSRPPLFHFFEGFMDAGKVGEGIAAFLLDNTEHKVLATFDMDLTHDYRARRPRMVFDTDSWKSVEPITLTLHLARDMDDRPFLLLTGPEPDMHWNGLLASLLDLIERLDVSLTFTANGVPMAVPHTRPVPLTVHATDIDLRETNPRWVDRLEIPASFAAYLELALGHAGRRAMGVAAHVPHYLAQGNYLPPVHLVLKKFVDLTGLRLPVDIVHANAETNMDAIRTETKENEDARQLIEALEQQYDQFSAAADAQLPSADELGEAVERFLAERDEADGDNPWG